jgi:hypothetical protein
MKPEAAITEPTAPVFGSDVVLPHGRLRRSATPHRAGVSNAVELRGGDALQRMPPAPSGVMLVNPPYGERIDVAGVAGITGVQGRDQRRQQNDREVQHDHRNQPIDEFGQPLNRMQATIATPATPVKSRPSRPRATARPTRAASRRKTPGARKRPTSFRSWPRTGRKTTRAGQPTC